MFLAASRLNAFNPTAAYRLGPRRGLQSTARIDQIQDFGRFLPSNRICYVESVYYRTTELEQAANLLKNKGEFSQAEVPPNRISALESVDPALPGEV